MEPGDEAGPMHVEGFGIKMSIDDFGTGYSSLSYLQAPNRQPQDRSVIRTGSESSRTPLVESIVALSASRNASIAEGVELRLNPDALCATGCNLVQGFLFCNRFPSISCSKGYRSMTAMAHGGPSRPLDAGACPRFKDRFRFPLLNWPGVPLRADLSS
jgi:EAL domain-containing protein (putative c-di-GMP-specific phosphodiesterase class I)